MPTQFQQKVYELCRLIPKGKVTTYKEIAKKLGIKSCQAVGGALKRNPYAPKVPCHRVVNSDGSLGGYCGKLNSRKKIDLLEKEGVVVENDKINDFDKLKISF